MTIHHLLEAELEILNAVTFYHERSGNIAAAFYEQFRKSRDGNAAFPEFLETCRRRLPPQAVGALSLRNHL